jgi:hypothetical protein
MIVSVRSTLAALQSGTSATGFFYSCNEYLATWLNANGVRGVVAVAHMGEKCPQGFVWEI